jgi:hypothetical protein
MLESLDHKLLVLEMLWDGKQVNRLMCELRLTLFVKAAEAHAERPECLIPFPSCFFDPKTKTKLFYDLIKHIDLIPKLDNIKVR